MQKIVKKFWFYDSVLCYDSSSWSIRSDPDVCLHLEGLLGGWWEYKDSAASDWLSCWIGT